MATIQTNKTIFKASPTQSATLRSNARFIGAFGGLGSGKTALGAVWAIHKAQQGKPGIIVSPDFPHFSKSTWPELEKWIPWSGVQNKRLNHPFTTDKRLIFNTPYGPTPVYYGGIDDPDAWRGPSVNWFWFDEARRKDKRRAFDILAGRIRVPPNPQSLVTTTPAGINHWLYNLFVKEDFPKSIKDLFAERDQKLVERFHMPTRENRENLDPMYYESLRGLYEGKFAQQELEAQFITAAGRVYEQFTDANVSSDAEYIPGVPIEWGVDDGYVQSHPRVILQAQFPEPDVCNIFDALFVTLQHPEESLEEILARPYPPPDVAYVDSSAADLRKRIWDFDIDTVQATHDVREGIKHLRSWVCDGYGKRHVFFHPDLTQCIEQMYAYRYPSNARRTSARAGQPKPAKENDDCPDGLRYLLYFHELDFEGASTGEDDE
ncbi:hypothetical protein GF373_17600 [bacterium]|nr:hypothetical protein [bacterium]